MAPTKFFFFLVISFFAYSTGNATNHYVDKNANGNNDGTSWTDAWESFADIDWGEVDPGETLFISGGTDSTTYNEVLNVNADGTADNLITIRKGWDTGHDGKVIIQGTIYVTRVLYATNRSYIRLVNLDVRNGRNGMLLYGSNVIYVDSCSVLDCQYGINVALNGGASDSIFILNSSVIFNQTSTNQTDCISGTGVSYLEIKNCYIFQGNERSRHGHSDCTQILYSGKQIYANNWMESVANPRDPDSSGSAGHNGQGGSITDTSLWYNNVMITRGMSYTLYHDAGTNGHTWLMYNNNIIKEYDDTDGGCIHTIESKTFGKNNIIFNTTDQFTTFNLSTTLSPGNSNFDYNLWWHPYYADIVSSRTFAEWQADGGDLNGLDGSPLWEDWHLYTGGYGNLDLRLQSGSPCIDAGTADVKAFIEAWGLTWESFNNRWIDWANGGTRSDTTPSIGVYEYGDRVPVELTSFTATSKLGNVILNWATATELNNRGFEIERSLDNSVWERISFVEGHGTTTEPREYKYVDVIFGVTAISLAYRLKQIDFDGSYEYSEVIYSDNFTPSDFALHQNFPNPFNPSTKIKYSVPQSSNVMIKIFDILGNEIETLVNEEKPIGTYELTWYAENLPSGIYFYRLQAGSFVETKKMVLLR